VGATFDDDDLVFVVDAAHDHDASRRVTIPTPSPASLHQKRVVGARATDRHEVAPRSWSARRPVPSPWAAGPSFLTAPQGASHVVAMTTSVLITGGVP
jgi:hypothetical protein